MMSELSTWRFLAMKMLMMMIAVLFSFNVSALDKAQKSKLLKMSDQELWSAGTSQQIGNCHIQDARKCESCYCDFYVKSNKPDIGEGGGLPHGYGTGCLVAPNTDKKQATCWSKPNVYDQYNKSKTPICTPDHVRNAANMLRIGIKRGICDKDA